MTVLRHEGLDLPMLLHSASKGEVVFAALLLRSRYQKIVQPCTHVVEVPLRGYRDQPIYARVDFTHSHRHPKVTYVHGPLARVVNR